MHHTTYVKATGVDDATTKMADGGQLLAGGMTLIPTMKQRLASPEMLVDLSGCGLSGIEDKGDSVRIGAMTRHADVARSDLVRSAVPALAALAGGIGDRQVRNCGTIGGSVAMGAGALHGRGNLLGEPSTSRFIKWLRSRFAPGTHVTFANLAVPGTTTASRTTCRRVRAS